MTKSKTKNTLWLFIVTIVLVSGIVIAVRIFSGSPIERRSVTKFAYNYLFSRYYIVYNITDVDYDFKTHAYTVYATSDGKSLKNDGQETIILIYNDMQITLIHD